MKFFVLFSLTVLSLASSGFTLSCPSTATECEGWEGEEISFELNVTNCPDGLTSEIEEAFELWNQVSTAGTKFKIGAANNESAATITNRVDGSAIAAHNPVITCDPNFQTTLGLSSAEVDAIPGVANSNTVGGTKINTAYVLLNVQSGAAANISNLSAELRKAVIAHEIGHALGLGHSAENSALMFFDVTGKAKLNLHQDDADGLSYLYPRSEPSDSPLGCGLVSIAGGGPPGPPPTPLTGILLILPLILLLGIRERSLRLQKMS